MLQVLRADGALLIYPAGHLEPEPADRPARAERRAPRSHWDRGQTASGRSSSWRPGRRPVAGRADLARRACSRLSTWRWFGPLLKLRRTLRGREDLTAVLQVAFPGLGPTTIRVRYGAPLDAAALAANDADVEAITARIRSAVQAQLRQATTAGSLTAETTPPMPIKCSRLNDVRSFIASLDRSPTDRGSPQDPEARECKDESKWTRQT